MVSQAKRHTGGALTPTPFSLSGGNGAFEVGGSRRARLGVPGSLRDGC
jgi:hypothetical protein